MQKAETLEMIDAMLLRIKRNKIRSYFPDDGEFRRELYPKHTSFFEAGAKYRQRLMLAANRVGKTESVGCYELTLHLTGQYPDWWTGRRFDRPIKAWAAGDTGKTTRDILQQKLLGNVGEFGTGLIPFNSLIGYKAKSGIADAIEIVNVRHASGGISTLNLKSYDQRREAFQGSEQDVILMDEEPPLDIYTECLLRTMTNNGMLMLTFTPLMGMSQVVMAFLPNGQLAEQASDSKFVVMATWDDVPHLDDAVKKELWESIPPFQRDARSKGVPQLGAGAIYPVPESDIVVDDFPIPEHWAKVYGMDVGWNRTAVVWGAIDRDTDTVYLFSEHYRGQAEPIVHAESIKSRGDWIPGVIDPASRGRSQVDGMQLYEQYVQMGLLLQPAVNAREAGLYAVWQRLSSGKLKVFRSLSNWLSEFRLYRRDEKGAIVKENDHCLHGNTKVITKDGLKKIKNMVGTRGLVLTISGKWAEYQNCRMTQQNTDVIKLTFSDGYTVTCTKNHKFLTIDGWIESSDMLGKSCYNEISYSVQRSIKWKLKHYQKHRKSLTAFGITCVANTFKETVKDCIELFGNSLTVKYQSGIMYTMLTETGQTTSFQTLSLKPQQNTLANIKKEYIKTFTKMRSISPQFGTKAKMVKTGINNTINSTKISYIKKLQENVCSAKRNLVRQSIQVENSVQMPVKQGIGLTQELITKLENVSNAAKVLNVTNTSKNKPAQEYVPHLLQCVSVQPMGKSDVYCLEVPTTQAFAIENGIIVHNCMDATRYLIMSGIDAASTEPKKKKQNYQHDAGGWMG